jgi:CMP/dCMP kinase
VSVSVPVIAIDGPAGAGKGTAAQALARALGWHYLDSGAFYRAAALAVLRAQVPFGDISALTDCVARLRIVQHLGAQGTELRLDGEDVCAAVRAEPVGEAASRIAAVSGVRRVLLDGQRACRRPPGLVAEGRDMATTVFPDAALKVFLTASPEARARRRASQLSAQDAGATLPTILKDLQARDDRDRAREVSPLRPAPGALVLDSTDLDAAAVLARLLEWCAQRGFTAPGTAHP